MYNAIGESSEGEHELSPQSYRHGLGFPAGASGPGARRIQLDDEIDAEPGRSANSEYEEKSPQSRPKVSSAVEEKSQYSHQKEAKAHANGARERQGYRNI